MGKQQQDTTNSRNSKIQLEMHKTDEKILRNNNKHNPSTMAKPSTESDEEEKNARDERKFKDAVLSNKLAAGYASFQQMKRFTEKSRLDRFDEEVHNVQWADIQRKEVLGQGAFSMVYKVQVTTDNSRSKRSLNSENFYALKHIKPDITEDSKDFRVAAIDLAVEGEILARLNHENIIKLHGIYGGSAKTAYVDSKHGYFLMFDVLEDTLTRRLMKMRRIAKKKKRNGNYTMLNMVQKVAIGIAKGLQYLHENGVILRDLKPDNVGFDENGVPKIFDLGFARELHTVHQSEVAGSLRYMSPEIGLSQGAALASDVYSFGVLLYELCTLEKPFKQYKARPEFIQDVFLNNYRPDLTNIISKAIRDVIAKCWDKDQMKRPIMKTVGNVLRVETALLNVRHQVRKSKTIRRNEQSMSSESTNTSSPSLRSFGSIGSFRPSPRNPSRRTAGPPSLNSTIHSTTDINSIARRSPNMRRLGSENFVWNSDSSASQESSGSSYANKPFGRPQRGRNALTNSLFASSKRRNSSNRLKESLSIESFGGLNNIQETSASTHDRLPIHSNHRSRRGLGSTLSRLSTDSMSSFVSFGGDSVATEMSTSNFTLGELKPRKLGMSKRNAIFKSISSKALFTFDIDRGSGFNKDENPNISSVIVDTSIDNEDLSLESSEEGELREPKQVEPITA